MFHRIPRSSRAAGLPLLALVLIASCPPCAAQPVGAEAHVPKVAPRTMVLAGRQEAFRQYCTTGEAAAAFNKIKEDFDRDYAGFPFPDEPRTYGDPDPNARDSDKADQWRAVQDLCGQVSGIAEAAALIWVVTGEEAYLAKAKEFLLKSSDWHFDPDWESGSVAGATDIFYNDEGNFRLWRKLPLVYDLSRDQFTPKEKARILASFKTRGERTVTWIKEGRVEELKRNSLEVKPRSHHVRFMAMVGLTGLALWDDLPEAREWWRFAYTFYRDQFSPWGGDDGGWGEGCAYWRGTFEHASFQDALLAIGDPIAYAAPFWKTSPYFALYNVQPYMHTTFGDVSNAGHFNLEPVIADYMEHLARVQQNGFLLAYADLCTDTRTRPVDKGLAGLDRTYPTACEFLIRNFIASARPLPEPRSLSELPSYRLFKDVGWVSLHSALGRPDDDIHVTFKSSMYGSYSHSHADQNAFILNAYGEGLAINSAYREFHRSPHHKEWTWQTASKNALLIDGQGQNAQDLKATGEISRFDVGDRVIRATGDATIAYQTGHKDPDRIQRVTRDLAFVDSRYVVLRDRVTLSSPGKLSWLLHAERDLTWDGAAQRALIRGVQGKATLVAQLVAPGQSWRGSVTDKFPVPVDPKYVSGEVGSEYVTGEWSNQSHLTLESAEESDDFTVFAVLWPDRVVVKDLAVKLHDQATLEIRRPDGKRDYVRVADEGCQVTRTPPSALPLRGSSTANVTPSNRDSSDAGVETTPEMLPGTETFIYVQRDNDKMRLHVIKPKNWNSNDRRPALVFFFGGGWTKGTPEKSVTWAKYAASLGMIGVVPDYRTKNRFGTSPLESVADARASVRWVQDHAAELGIDPAKIVVGGNSAGGHLALWTAIAAPPPGSGEGESPTRKPAAVILFSAVSDTAPLTGYTPQRFGSNTLALSPIHELDAVMPPMLIFHGDADPTVPYAQAVALDEALRAGGNTSVLVTVPGGNHGFSTQFPEWKDKGRRMVQDFLMENRLLPPSP